MKKQCVLLFLFSFLAFYIQEDLILCSNLENAVVTVDNAEYRSHQLNEEILSELMELEPQERGRKVGIYLLIQSLPDRFQNIKISEDYDNQKVLESYVSYCDAIWNEVQYFPIPESTSHNQYTVSYVDTWNAERTYGGKRGHEGVDLMASENQPGLYPVVSMTDGIITHKGWLEMGGWRVGILSSSGAYFYYAHLDSYGDIEVGDEIEAGEIIGFMGNSGYGPEGTTGMFATHLHLGIYIYPEGEEVSINPYWVLRLAEEKKLFCSF